MPDADLSLSKLFRERSLGVAAGGEAELETALAALYAEAAAAWPGLRLSPEAFVVHLAERGVAGPPFHGVRSADLYLACACATRVRGAVEVFDRVHLSRVGAFVSRMRPSA